MSEQYLEHHGVKGQKWGVRRYQNRDGSLTAEGKALRKGALGTIGGIGLKSSEKRNTKRANKLHAKAEKITAKGQAKVAKYDTKTAAKVDKLRAKGKDNRADKYEYKRDIKAGMKEDRYKNRSMNKELRAIKKEYKADNARELRNNPVYTRAVGAELVGAMLAGSYGQLAAVTMNRSAYRTAAKSIYNNQAIMYQKMADLYKKG